MSYDWLNLWKASRVQKKLHEQHGANGAASGWPATGARYWGKIVTGIQGGKLPTAKKIRFLQAPVASFVCELFSVFRQLRSELWCYWIAHLSIYIYIYNYYYFWGGITFSISMYIICVCLFSALSRRVGALQISSIIIIINRTACLFLSLQFSLTDSMALLFSNLHPSITDNIF